MNEFTILQNRNMYSMYAVNALTTMHCPLYISPVSLIAVVAFGKAVIGMVKASAEILCEHVITGLASIPAGTLNTLGVSHPEYLPDPQSQIKYVYVYM